MLWIVDQFKGHERGQDFAVGTICSGLGLYKAECVHANAGGMSVQRRGLFKARA
jgi:hypothetical protein